MVDSLTTDRAIERAIKILAAQKAKSEGYLSDPTGFVRHVLKEELWSKQREVAESVVQHRHTAVRSAHDTGKSFIASRIAAWWLSVHPPGEAFVVTSAPSFAQVRAILWREIKRAHRKGKLRGTTNQTEWWIDGELVAFGRKPADYDESAFQGIHARYVLVILDEACGIPTQLWNAAETITTNENSRILAIGNPDTPLSEFKRKTESSVWHTIHIDGLKSPNFTGEQIHPDPVQDAIIKESLIAQVWVDERREDWGEDSPLWLSKVRGNFPLVPEGQVYKELSPSQEWFGPLPTFQRYVGGLDFGGQQEGAHYTTAVVAGLASDESIQRETGDPIARLSSEGSAGVMVRLYHFEHEGPLVHDQLMDWMHYVERQVGRRIEWMCDKSQSGWISLAGKAPHSFLVEPANGASGSVDLGIGMQRRRMRLGTSFFVEDLTKRPRFMSGEDAGIEMSCGGSWFDMMGRYRWEKKPDDQKKIAGVPLKVDDDTADADRYMHEAADGFPINTAPPLSPSAINGKRLARFAA